MKRTQNTLLFSIYFNQKNDEKGNFIYLGLGFLKNRKNSKTKRKFHVFYMAVWLFVCLFGLVVYFIYFFALFFIPVFQLCLFVCLSLFSIHSVVVVVLLLWLLLFNYENKKKTERGVPK